jgi:hypothetical protein
MAIFVCNRFYFLIFRYVIKSTLYAAQVTVKLIEIQEAIGAGGKA